MSAAKSVHPIAGSFIVLTEEGFEDFRRSSVPHLQFVKELFIDAFDDDGLAQVDTVTSTLRTHLSSHHAAPLPGQLEFQINNTHFPTHKAKEDT